MKVAIIFPFAGKRMIEIPFWQLAVIYEQANDFK